MLSPSEAKEYANAIPQGMIQPLFKTIRFSKAHHQTQLLSAPKRKKMNFLQKRTCFRAMSDFYKQLFAPYLKIWIEQKKTIDMQALVQDFANAYFASLLTKMTIEK